MLLNGELPQNNSFNMAGDLFSSLTVPVLSIDIALL